MQTLDVTRVHEADFDEFVAVLQDWAAAHRIRLVHDYNTVFR